MAGVVDPRWAAEQARRKSQREIDEEYYANRGRIGYGPGGLRPSRTAQTRLAELQSQQREAGPSVVSMAPVTAGTVSPQQQSAGPGPTPYAQRQWQLTDEARRRKWQQEDREKLLSYFGQSGQGLPPSVTHPGLDTGREADARAAAFARAKDQAGRVARSSLTSIAEEMAGRGISGSGIEALRAAGGIGEAAEPMQELTRTQAMGEAQRAADISDLGYQGGITQRGQDLANRQSYLALLRSLY